MPVGRSIKKSDAELDYMREAARISENAMQRRLDVIGPRRRQYEAAGSPGYAHRVDGPIWRRRIRQWWHRSHRLRPTRTTGVACRRTQCLD